MDLSPPGDFTGWCFFERLLGTNIISSCQLAELRGLFGPRVETKCYIVKFAKKYQKCQNKKSYNFYRFFGVKESSENYILMLNGQIQP